MVNIVGGGISGMASGITLARAGIKTTIYEQHEKVGMGCGHNIMAIRNYDMDYDQMDEFRKMGLDLNISKPINKIIKYAPSGRSMEIFSKDKPLFYAIMRGPDDPTSFDTQLLGQYEDEGGKVETGQKKSLLSGDIIATRSIFRNFWCTGSEFTDVNVNPDTILFFMDNRYCPRGYIYLVPWGKHEVSIAATTYDLSCSLPILFQKFLGENKIMQEILDDSSELNGFGCTAYSNIPKTAKAKNRLFVGSAAGFLDSARGFGIKYALVSGVLAGKSISEGLDFDKLWKNSFEKELMDSFSRRLILEKMSNDDYEKFITKDKLPVGSYDKFPSYLKPLLQNIKISKELNLWRNKYNLAKLFN